MAPAELKVNPRGVGVLVTVGVLVMVGELVKVAVFPPGVQVEVGVAVAVGGKVLVLVNVAVGDWGAGVKVAVGTAQSGWTKPLLQLFMSSGTAAKIDAINAR